MWRAYPPRGPSRQRVYLDVGSILAISVLGLRPSWVCRGGVNLKVAAILAMSGLGAVPPREGSTPKCEPQGLHDYHHVGCWGCNLRWLRRGNARISRFAPPSLSQTWDLASGVRSLEEGQWSLASGLWNLASGFWLLVAGPPPFAVGAEPGQLALLLGPKPGNLDRPPEPEGPEAPSWGQT